MRQLQLIAHGEPSDVIELKTVPEPPLGQDDVLISMEAAPMNPSDFLFVRGTYGIQPAFLRPISYRHGATLPCPSRPSRRLPRPLDPAGLRFEAS
jgi:NADPH:quinone reductase-like Zn-dependent oxidoreductase